MPIKETIERQRFFWTLRECEQRFGSTLVKECVDAGWLHRIRKPNKRGVLFSVAEVSAMETRLQQGQYPGQGSVAL